MTDTKVLLQKIAALRQRLSESAELPDIEQKVQAGATHNRLIEATLKSALQTEHATPTPEGMRLSGRGARLLRKGRESLQALRAIADDAEFESLDDENALAQLHREATAMIEMILRTAQAFPTSMSAQLRLCDGLEVVLTEVDERIALLRVGLANRKQQTSRIDEMAIYLRGLAAKQPAGLEPLQALADALIAEANRGEPLRFLYAAPVEPARFAAAHGLTVAQVLARVLRDDTEWQPQLQLAVMAALVHDVGMACVPAEVLSVEGPLDSNERRLVEKHTIVAESMLEKLWPGGAWPVEAACAHHERSDGTGYPLGRHEIQIAPFVKLLAACDVYAALCAERPHRPAFDTRTALTETLLLAERGYLDRAWVERLLLLSFYPVGSAVELNDGAAGLVIATHPAPVGIAYPDRPIVQVLCDAQGHPPAFPLVIDLLERTDCRIARGLSAADRLTRLGKQYPQVI
jgi:HD-GYP domain-containing protein (c-di-GMP phosphodiesterase class II)